MHKRHVVTRRLLVACRYPTKMLDPTEKTLDLVAILVELAVDIARGFAVVTTRNDRLSPERLNVGHQVAAVIALVGQHRLDFFFVVGAQERLGLRAVAGLTRWPS